MTGKRICGVGINDSPTPIIKFEREGVKRKVVWKCPFYSRWHNMIHRCYNKNYPKGYYGKVTVYSEWLIFSKFKSWMESQDWEGKHLDKDILGDGKEYSPEKCCFVPARINTLINESRKNNGEMVNIRYIRGRYEAYVSDGLKIVSQSFDNIPDAVNFWVSIKEQIVKEETKEGIIRDALLDYYSKSRDRYLEMYKTGIF